MPVPTVVSSSPADNATGVAIQTRLEIVFSTALERSTANDGTILLYEADGAVPISGLIEFSSDSTTVYFSPFEALRPNWSYILAAVGDAESLPAGAVESATGHPLASSYSANFRTGTERFVSLEEVTDRTDIEHIAPIREASELAETTGGVLSIVSSSPEGFSTNQDDPDTISVTFDGPLASSSFSENWLTLEMRPILDYEDYYLGNYNDDDEKTLKIEDEDLDVSMPSGTVTMSGSTLTWTKSSGSWPFNAEVTITLSEDIEDTSGNTLGREVKIVFTTLLFPLYVGSQFLRLELGSSVRGFFDDSLNRMALKRGVEAWELTGRRFELENPPYVAREYTKYGAIIDVIETIALKADLARGQRKKLGDFEVDYGAQSTLLNSARHLSAKKKLELAEGKLRLFSPSLKARFAAQGILSGTGPQELTGIRNWDNLFMGASRVVPAANWKEERELKLAWEQMGSVAGGIMNPREVLTAFYGRYDGTPFDRFYIVRGN